MAWPYLPASCVVRTSCPSRRSSSTAGRGKFSFAYKRAMSRALVLSDLRVDFSAMAADIGPCTGQILRAETRKAAKDVGLARAQSPCLFEQPDRNSCADDARLAAADARYAFNSRCGVPKVAHYQLQQLRLFGAGHSGKQLFGVAQRGTHR